MNYLAHAYLSFNDPDILAGNMISDFVKGKKKYDYPQRVQQGIALHRIIDEFTDSHAATKEAKEIFRPAYRLYSGSIMDVIYDHFLANDENAFTDASLYEFTIKTYKKLDQFTHLFPEKFNRMYPYMKSQNWLYHYRHPEGTEKSLGGLVRRSKYLTESETAFRLFTDNYQTLELLYKRFFPGVSDLALNYLKQFSD